MRRILPPLLLATVLLTALPVSAQAQDEGDDIVRLPGQGLVKPDSAPAQRKLGKLVPGGGLFASFDADNDGRISVIELADGTRAAFLAADTNGDGQIGALEQQDWAAGLPTRDDSLANPVRFDPNLDRVVTFEEFASVITELAANYQDDHGVIEMAKLSAPEPKPERGDRRPSGPPQGRQDGSLGTNGN
jgi:hypothetical protein